MSAPVSPLDIGALGRAIDTLFAEHPELATDETLRADMLEGSTSLHDVLTRLLERRQEAKTMATAIGARIRALELRAARYEMQQEATETLMQRVLEMAEQRRVVLPEATILIRAGRNNVEVPDPSAVPDEFCRIEKKPNRIAIREAIESGQSINWATLSEPKPTLNVRVR